MSGVLSASCPSCSEPEAFVGAEGGVVERDRFLGVVVGFGGCWCWFGGVVVCVLDGDFVEEQEPFDGSFAVLDRHAAVVAEQVSDLTVQALES